MPQTTSEPRYAFSTDGEEYHGSFETRGHALEAALKELSRGDTGTVYTGKRVEPDLQRWLGLTAMAVLEELSDQATNDDFPVTDGWLDNVRPEQMDALKHILVDGVGGWLKTYKLEPEFWFVEDVDEHDIESHLPTDQP